MQISHWDSGNIDSVTATNACRNTNRSSGREDSDSLTQWMSPELLLCAIHYARLWKRTVDKTDMALTSKGLQASR